MIATILTIAAGILIFIYLQNRLAAAKNAVTTGYSGIDVQLKRRHDLIPALVDSVRGAMAQENRIFDRLLDARRAAMSARNLPALTAFAPSSTNRSALSALAEARLCGSLTRQYRRKAEK